MGIIDTRLLDQHAARPERLPSILRRVVSRVLKPGGAEPYFTPRPGRGIWYDVLDCGHEVPGRRSATYRACADCAAETWEPPYD